MTTGEHADVVQRQAGKTDRAFVGTFGVVGAALGLAAVECRVFAHFRCAGLGIVDCAVRSACSRLGKLGGVGLELILRVGKPASGA
eukprot:4030683-Prymnesium_polylepis.1